jgi:hypothetical protein
MTAGSTNPLNDDAIEAIAAAWLLTNNRNVVYGNINDIVQTSNTYFRPRIGEDISSPAHRTVPGSFNYIPPRSYTLSAKLNY